MKSTILFGALFVASGAATAQGIIVDKGQWTVQTDLGGYKIEDGVKSELDSESTSVTECWSTEDHRLIDKDTVAPQDCSIVSEARYGQRLVYDMSCKFDDVSMDGDITILVDPEHESVLANVVMKAIGDGVEVVAWTDMWMHRIGAC
jgi:hypothetical protein